MVQICKIVKNTLILIVLYKSFIKLTDIHKNGNLDISSLFTSLPRPLEGTVWNAVFSGTFIHSVRRSTTLILRLEKA